MLANLLHTLYCRAIMQFTVVMITDVGKNANGQVFYYNIYMITYLSSSVGDIHVIRSALPGQV